MDGTESGDAENTEVKDLSDDESTEIDSLDSQAELKRQAKVKIVTPEFEDVGPPIPDLSRRELDLLVSYVKKMTTLYNLEECDWNQNCIEVIKEFMLMTGQPVLCVYFNGETLQCTLGFPVIPIYDMTYFLRRPFDVLRPENFHENITFGTAEGNVDSTILKAIQYIYAPIFFNMNSWPDSVKSEFSGQLHNFLAKLTDLHYKMSGLTVLYVPYEGINIPTDEAVKDKDLIKRLEGVVVHWTRQIRLCLSNQKAAHTNELPCPKDEYKFWIAQYENLAGLRHQFENRNLNKISQILKATHSSYISQFLAFVDEIEQSTIEAKSNIEYLQILIEPCDALQNVSSLEEIPDKLPRILNLIRVIWLNSPYYNTKKQITMLCKYLSNQMIMQCSDFIDLKSIFEGKTRAGMKCLHECINTLLAYKNVYNTVSEIHTKNSDTPWDLYTSHIFNHVDSYIKRCNDLIEICENMIIFARMDEMEDIPKPVFGGTIGVTCNAMCEKIEVMFLDYMGRIEKIQDKILNVQALEWHEEMLKFRHRMKSLDIIATNIANGMFEQHTNMEEAVETMTAMYNLFKRHTLRQLWQGKTDEVYKMFEKEIRGVKIALVQEQDDYMTALPQYAGKALIINFKKNKITYLKKVLDDSPWLICGFKDDVFTQYHNQMKSIDNMVREVYLKWVKLIGDDNSQRLNRTLLARSIAKPGYLECNIDRFIITMCEECQYWEQLNFKIPFAADQIYSKYDNIKIMYEKVTNVVLNYNKIISSLSDDERLLFRQLINNVDRKIAPGILKLNWTSDISDEYIAECCSNTEELQNFIDDYKICNMQIVKICEKISNCPLLQMPTGRVYKLNELRKKIIEYICISSQELAIMYQEIIRYVIVVFEGFESTIHYISEHWDGYIRNFDALLGEAIRICIKTSLEDVYYALHGDDSTGPTPLLKVEAFLGDKRVEYIPPLEEINVLITGILPQFIEAIKQLPRLCDKFKVYGERPSQFNDMIESDKECISLQLSLKNEAYHGVTAVNDFSKTWDTYKDIWDVDKARFLERYENRKPKASEFEEVINNYREMAENVQNEEPIIPMFFILVTVSLLKSCIIDHCNIWERKLIRLLERVTESKIYSVYEYVRINTYLLQCVPKTIKELLDITKLHKQLAAEAPIKSEIFLEINDQIDTLWTYEIELRERAKVKNDKIPEVWEEYLEVLKRSEQMISFSRESFRTKLLEDSEVFKIEARKMFDDFLKNGPFTEEWSAKEALQFIGKVKRQVGEIRSVEEDLRKDLAIFNIHLPLSQDLQSLELEIATIELVWEITEEWNKAWDRYKPIVVWLVDLEEVGAYVQSQFRKLTRLAQELMEKEWSIIEHTRNRVDYFRKTLPVIADLRNPAMRIRHWEKVKQVTKTEFNERSSSFLVDSIVEMRMQDYSEFIGEISYAATMELEIENGLKSIAESWKTMSIVIEPHDNGIYKIESVEDCFEMLDEHTTILGRMKSTRFVEPFSREVDYWERTLSYIQESLEMCLSIQRQWLYFENIFYGEDIRKQLPHESNYFEILTIEWRDITSHMYKGKTALHGTHYIAVPLLLKKLHIINEKLEFIQRELERYLEMKRQIFPRFYFISNEDLLEILGNAKKPEVIQKYLKKLFSNLYKLQVNKLRKKEETVGMYSEDGEYVQFISSVPIDGPSEIWLHGVEKAMRYTLRTMITPCYEHLLNNLKTRAAWLPEWCGQLCNTATKIRWTEECEKVIKRCKLLDSTLPLKKLRGSQKKVLMMLSDMARTDLRKIQRLKVNALITIEIHGKEIFDKLYKENCMDTTDFLWVSQLRFFLNRKTGDCNIRQTNTSFLYHYEYIGNTGRLVITPLTERCFITLTTALHLYRGGSPQGPAGTGKTETIKDLAKTLGMWVIVINCSEGLDFKSMAKMFSGLSQTGAWGCFDEFNRINVEVLSVVAQQILAVLSAISQDLEIFCLEGQEISMINTCGIFITMNPGYAGRTELPDNLKSMFRPISMILPDNLVIAQNVLFSDGFMGTKVLAKKVYTLYELCTQQLSKQDHYDFGLRSMVALLRYAGQKRRAHPEISEEEMVYLAMRDMNTAKLTVDDLGLFNGMMADIFPGLNVQTMGYETLSIAIREASKSLQLEPTQSAITKVIQLHETKASRHCVMIIGKTLTGKTATWKLLKGALGQLYKQNVPGFYNVYDYPINPKALLLGELYGYYNLTSGEWLDGVLPTIMRKICLVNTPQEKWIVFDGPVDVIWIENMNSVMDDNRVLTLINSERITMPEQVSLLFEVENLAAASPATVSRCGMVYIDYRDLGWKPYAQAWLNALDKEEYQTMLNDYFFQYLPIMLDFKRLNCEDFMPISELNLVISLCKLLEIFFTKENGVDPANEDDFDHLGRLWFLFCMVWSICATVTSPGRRKMDTFIRENEGAFPLKETVYEYYVSTTRKSFVLWEEMIPKDWHFQADAPFYKIIVPTLDTMRYTYIIKALLQAGQPTLIIGPLGTGKTYIAQSVLTSLDNTKYSILTVNMAPHTTATNLQATIESRVEKRTKEVFIPLYGKSMILFLDDLNMPIKDEYGSQPPLELIRQWMGYGYWYNRRTQFRIYIENMCVLAAMGPPGAGRTVISQRLLNCFTIINMTFPSEAQIIRMYDTMLSQHFLHFDHNVKRLSESISKITLSLYKNVTEKMLPTPTKIHYLFNLRDISKVFQGLLRSNKNFHTTRQAILRLWIHESFRVFYDRLVNDKDREWFMDRMNEELGRMYEITLHSICPYYNIPIFGDFINKYKMYEDHVDKAVLRRYLEDQLHKYNSIPGVTKISVIFFKETVEHICKIIRVITQPAGHMFLVGIGGSGRQSLIRLASYICGNHIFQIEVTRNYKLKHFCENLKQLYRMTGVGAKPNTFLFRDSDIANECFLEYINNILCTGEIPNLFNPEELEDIRYELINVARKERKETNPEAIYSFLISRARKNLHINLCMSPIGEKLRNRVRQYPSIVNCTTIDWFLEWPKSALLEVANEYLTGINFAELIGEDNSDVDKAAEAESRQITMRSAVAQIFATMHDSVTQHSLKMIQQMKRYNYVTPTNYLQLVSSYKLLLAEKRKALQLKANKLRNGLLKIDSCRVTVEAMTIELETATVKVTEFQQACDDYMVVIVNQTREADEKQKEVTAESIKIAAEEKVCMALAAIAQADLDLAMPAFEEAIAALDSLNKKDIAEVRSYGKPPQKVEMVMEAVMILKQVPSTWVEAKRQLGEQNFLANLKEFDKNHIPEKVMKKIANYTSNVEFVPEKVGIVSQAAKSLCMWVIAIEKYYHIYKIVAPKQAKLEEALASLREKQKILAALLATLKEISETLERLKKEYDEKFREKEELQRRAVMLQRKLERAALLVGCLAGEKVRWHETLKLLDVQFEYLPGDCLLSAAFVSYLGAFLMKYRFSLVKLWSQELKTLNVPYSPTYNVVSFLSDPVKVRVWNIQGLPADPFSTENGIIVTRATRWPLIIDPQNQAQRWIKQMEQDKNNFRMIDFGVPQFMKIIETAIQYGKVILLRNAEEALDPAIIPLINKAIIKQGGHVFLKLHEKMIQYNTNFRFYITTKLSNPHYPPEIATKTTLVNFAVVEQGLETQLLAIVVRIEQAKLEEQKDELVTTIADGKMQLIHLEDELLRILNETRGSLLDDEQLVITLQNSKDTSTTITKSLLVAETTERGIDIARENYRPCAKRAAILFFVLCDMCQIDPMYQFSLDSYISLFTSSIKKSPDKPTLDERISALRHFHTYATYTNTCRCLFGKHKLLFAFHMCIKILESQDKIVPDEYRFLLTGGRVLDRSKQKPNPCTRWLDEQGWDNITELENIKVFVGIINSFQINPDEWEVWYKEAEPERKNLIEPWNDACNAFQRMLIVRSVRTDRLTNCIARFIMTNLGPKFVEPPVFDIKAVLEDSLPQTPLIFVLSASVDPTAALIQLAEQNHMSDRIATLSLGQGQAPIATKMLVKGMKIGLWVFLANCHLSLSWMPALDKMVESFQTEPLHPDFRLWLSSDSHPEFPISILQASIKMTTEPPQGMKANLKRLYQDISEEQYYICQSRDKYEKLLYALCFFHAIILERKKFLQLGWNIPYSFNNSDFEVSEQLLAIYLDEYKETPWVALKYLIAEVNYGGHVIDDWDHRLLITYINQYFVEDVLYESLFKLSESPLYVIPNESKLDQFRKTIELLPNSDHPEVFGQHLNADVTCLISEGLALTHTLMSLQLQTSGVTEQSKEDKVYQIAEDVLSKLPLPMDYETTDKNIGPNKQPLDAVLLQEVFRYNGLLHSIIQSLDDLRKGIKGLVIMSAELEDIFVCIYEGTVPNEWLNAYQSIKPLGSWTRDLILRVEMFTNWAVTTHPPNLFWLSAHTLPRGFLTAVLQVTARATSMPIDRLKWEFITITDEDLLQEVPQSGAFISGMFLEGAGWDSSLKRISEPLLLKLFYPMPVIHFKPVVTLSKKNKEVYLCPCYYSPVRSGLQGRSAFVVAVELLCAENSEYWVKRGTALLLSLAN